MSGYSLHRITTLPVAPNRRQFVRYSTVAFGMVLVALMIVGYAISPGDVEEAGLEWEPMTKLVFFAACAVTLPALPLLVALWTGLSAAGVPDTVAMVTSAIPGACVAAAFWGWLSALVTNWLRARHAA